jgi:DNA-binding MarR family transcriptional regulator
MTRQRPVVRLPHSALRRSPAFALRFVAERMRKSVGEALAEHGLSWVEYSILMVACDIDGLSQMALGERTCTDRTRVSQAVVYMEERALVQRDPVIDRRRRLVHPTELGREALAAIMPFIEQAERAALLPLDPRERARLSALLTKLIPPDRAGVWAILPERGP